MGVTKQSSQPMLGARTPVLHRDPRPFFPSLCSRRRKAALIKDIGEKVKGHGPGMATLVELANAFCDLMNQVSLYCRVGGSCAGLHSKGVLEVPSTLFVFQLQHVLRGLKMVCVVVLGVSPLSLYALVADPPFREQLPRPPQTLGSILSQMSLIN